jgi:uncharacterized protein YndB with AHSA1/START domain
MTDSLEIHVAVTVRVSAAEAWQALVSETHRRSWFPHLELDPRVGGRLIERWRNEDGGEVSTTGEVLEVDPPWRLSCTWRDDEWPAATEVEFEIRADERATRIHVGHIGWERLGGDGPRLREAHLAGWRRHLSNLRDYLEGASTR